MLTIKNYKSTNCTCIASYIANSCIVKCQYNIATVDNTEPNKAINVVCSNRGTFFSLVIRQQVRAAKYNKILVRS